MTKILNDPYLAVKQMMPLACGVLGWAVGGESGVKLGIALGCSAAIKANGFGAVDKIAEMAGEQGYQVCKVMIGTTAKIMQLNANVILVGVGLLTVAWTAEHLQDWCNETESSSRFAFTLGNAGKLGLSAVGAWEINRGLKKLMRG